MQMHFASPVNAGFFVSSVIGFGGTQGAVVAGMHAEGAPRAAITAGFKTDVHMPNGMMFTIGIWSMIVAAGFPSTIGTPGSGSTTRLDGATPNVQVIIAPEVTCGGMGRR